MTTSLRRWLAAAAPKVAVLSDALNPCCWHLLGQADPDPDRLVILLVAATGRLSDPAMKLLKFVVQDSPSRAILNHFCTQIGGAIGRYNAMVAHVWVQYYLRSSHISVGEAAG